MPLTGRKQVPWSTLLPRRRGPAAVPVPVRPRPERGRGAGPAVSAESCDISGARRAGGLRDRSERNLTVLIEQIDEAAASRGDAPYLEDAAGTATLTYAGLQNSVRAWASHLDEAGSAWRPGGGPAAGRVRLRLRPGRHRGGGPGGGPA